jgi:histidine ammonia-lyase
MSFLRSERLLNKYLNKSDIANNQHFSYLMILLKKNSYLVCENKQLAISSSADTILLNNYTHDVYANEGSSYKRLLALLQNTKRIVKLELMAALEVIFGMYGKKGSLFANDSMEKTYL